MGKKEYRQTMLWFWDWAS